jgi:hypothetical protein
MMLHIIRKQIDLARSTLLYDTPVSPESLAADWQVYSGEWTVDSGWLTGKNPGNFPGMIVSRAGFPGNVIVDFEARTVPPCTHDINFMWNGSWDEAKNERGVAYVAGLQGWWAGKIGFEKSPEYKLNAATPLFDFEPGRIYHIQGGSIEGHCFVFIDGRLVLEVTDPDPIDGQRFARVGFEAYCSHIQIRNIKVWRPAWAAVDMRYTPEFD